MKLARRCFLLASLALAACGGAPAAGGGPAGAPTGPAPQPKPKNAGEIARQLVGGRVGALVYAEKARGHQAVGKVLALPQVQSALGGSGLDPQRDVDRVFVTAPNVRERSDVIGVLQHHLTEEQVLELLRRRVDASKASSPGDGFLPGVGFPVARLTIRGDTRVVALVEPGVVVVLPPSRVGDAARFVGTGGLPDSSGPEAALLWADQPAHTLQAPRVPPVPPSVGRADGAVYLSSDGGARVVVDGASSSESQAASDAASLTQSVDEATSVRVAFLKMRVLPRPIAFRAEGSHVRADVPLSAGEIDAMLGLLARFLPA